MEINQSAAAERKVERGYDRPLSAIAEKGRERIRAATT
jgi:hypothetical protein